MAAQLMLRDHPTPSMPQLGSHVYDRTLHAGSQRQAPVLTPEVVASLGLDYDQRMLLALARFA